MNRPLKYAKQKRAIHESPLRTHIIFGGELVFSADLCYIGDNEKASPLDRGGTRQRWMRSQNDTLQ